MKLFGFKIERDTNDASSAEKSFAPEIHDDGAVVVAAGGTFGTYVDLDGTVRTEAELVSKYRELSLQPEIIKAIDEITNEAIIIEDNNKIVEIVLDDMPVKDNLKKIISQEFENILNLIDFKNDCYEIFKRWYIDGRCYYHAIIDETKIDEGLKELRYIDPRKIRKIREIKKTSDPSTGVPIQTTKDEYYMYNDRGFNYSNRQAISDSSTSSGIRINADSIIHVTSGIMDENNTMVLSYLHPAIKPMNQLRALEDSSLIYHLSRAPERRVFKIDVGNLPKMKAEQYVREMMTKFKNKLTYNAQTGEVKDDRKFMTMLEDFWLPIREGGRGTQIDVLQGGTALPQLLESVGYFQDRLYRALQVPLTRLKPDSIYNLGRATEITRDEVNFSKFIGRIRLKFAFLFISALEKQLILKNIMTPDDWDQLKRFVKFKYNEDNYFSELKELELVNERFGRLQTIDQFAGKYVSHTWIRKNIIGQTDEDIEQENELMYQEMQNPQYNAELLQQELNSNQEKSNGNSK